MKNIIALLVALLLVSGSFVIYKKYQTSNNYSFPNNTEEIVVDNCGKEGALLCGDNKENCSTKCCDGLKPMQVLKYSGKCTTIPAPGTEVKCSNCGNGICESKNGEDECNCSQDCK